MNFPIEFHISSFNISAHFIFESLGYIIGFRYYKYLRSNFPQNEISIDKNLWLITGCIFGAALGSKLLNILDAQEFTKLNFLNFFLGGKTIVGGFIGGWAGVEVKKYFNQIKFSTGDLFVFPTIIGTCIGRIGCFLQGLEDGTYGIKTKSIFGVNFGDGIYRHPTQLYEILYLLLIYLLLKKIYQTGLPNGTLFRIFMMSYFIFRFSIEFIKPNHIFIFGLSAIQVASLLMVFYCSNIFFPKSKYYFLNRYFLY
jgi:prolipoprotein diacylglyceryltransferase